MVSSAYFNSVVTLLVSLESLSDPPSHLFPVTSPSHPVRQEVAGAEGPVLWLWDETAGQGDDGGHAGSSDATDCGPSRVTCDHPVTITRWEQQTRSPWGDGAAEATVDGELSQGLHPSTWPQWGLTLPKEEVYTVPYTCTLTIKKSSQVFLL